MATLLVRDVGRRHGVDLPAVRHLRAAWPYAAAGAGAGLLMLGLVTR